MQLHPIQTRRARTSTVQHRAPGRPRRPWAAIVALWCVFGPVAIPAASAAPGNPGVPGAPTLLYEENFESGAGNTELEA